MATEFQDNLHYAMFKGAGAYRTGNAFDVRWSEITLAALRAAGVLDNMVDGLIPPVDTGLLWLDKNHDPAQLKVWDSTGLTWVLATFAKLFDRNVHTLKVTPLVNISGSANLISVVEPASFFDGLLYSVTPVQSNTGNMFITVQGVGTYPVMYANDQHVQPNEMRAHAVKVLLYYGSKFYVLFPTADAFNAMIAAQAAADEAESYRDQAAGYVNDIVSEKEVPITATRNGMEALQFPAGMNSLETRGYAIMGDGGGAQYRLAISEPAHGLKVQSQDGSWWEAVTNGGVNVAIVGAFPGADVTTRIQAIADYLALKGGGEILFTQPGTYTISSVNLYGKTSVFAGDGVTLQHKDDATTAMFLAQGAKSGVQLSIAATVSADATSLQLVDASSISAGDWIILKDTTDYSTDGAAVGYKSGESLIVKSKAGNTLNFDRKIFGSFQTDRAYTAARGAHVETVTPLASIRVYGPGSIRGHQNFNVGPLEFAYVDDVSVEDVRISNFGGCGVLFRTCRNIVAKPRHVSDGRNDVGAGFPGYGVAIWGACDIVLVADMSGTRTRHVFTTMGSADGASTSVHVDRCQGYENDFTAFDTHEGVHDITFSDCKVRGGNAANSSGGFFSRAPETSFLNCEAVGVPGRGIGAAGQALRLILIQGGLVDGSGGDGLGVPASCENLRINGIDVWRSGGNGITLMSGGPNELFPSVIDISDVNIRGFGLTVANRSGISGTTTFASVVNIDDVTVDGGGGSAARGVYLTGPAMTGKVSRVKARGSYSINPVQVPFSMDNMDHEIDGVPTKLNIAIPDDGVYFLKGASNTHVQYSISAAGSGASLPNGIFSARTSASPQCFGITSFGANVVFQIGNVLTGTTGADGNMTISATSTGVYIENRTGASVTINLVAAPSLRR